MIQTFPTCFNSAWNDPLETRASLPVPNAPVNVPVTVAMSPLVPIEMFVAENLRETLLKAPKLASKVCTCCLGIAGQTCLIRLDVPVGKGTREILRTLLIAGLGSSDDTLPEFDDGSRPHWDLVSAVAEAC